MKARLLGLSLVLFLSGCVLINTKFDKVGTETYLMRQVPENITVLTTLPTSRRYKIIGNLFAEGNSFADRNKIQTALCKKASEMGADALVNLEINGWSLSPMMNMYSGTAKAIRYLN